MNGTRMRFGSLALGYYCCVRVDQQPAPSAQPLRGSTLAVTGGTSGIGLGIATALLESGARVVVMGRTGERAAQAREAIDPQHNERFHVVSGDVGLEADRVRLIGRTMSGIC